MTNQDRGMLIANSLHAVEGALKVALPLISNKGVAAELNKAMLAHHAVLLEQATAMAAPLGFDVAAFSAGGDKR
jgi:hypothetical protein